MGADVPPFVAMDRQEGGPGGLATDETEATVPRRSGYLAAGIGTFLGGLLGLAAGKAIALPLAAHAASQVDTGSEAEDWAEAIAEALAQALAAALAAMLAYILAIILTMWLGTVLGCWIALALSRNDRALRTALFAGCLGPPIAYALLWGTQALLGSAGEVNGYLLYGIGVTLIALPARHLATRL